MYYMCNTRWNSSIGRAADPSLSVVTAILAAVQLAGRIMSSTTDTESSDGGTAQLEAAELPQGIRLTPAQAVEFKPRFQRAVALTDGTANSDWPRRKGHTGPTLPGPGGRQSVGISAAVVVGSFTLIAWG